MKKLFEAADNYLDTCTWKDLALIKLCLFAIGVMAGCALQKKEHKKPAFLVAFSLFWGTYIPLMYKFITVGVLPLLPGHEEF